MKLRALAVFDVMVPGLWRRVRVRVLPDLASVAAAYGGTRALARHGLAVQAFYRPGRRRDGPLGTIVLPARGGDLAELVAHEAVHAVMHALDHVRADADEPLATRVGHLAAGIHLRLAARHIGA